MHLKCSINRNFIAHDVESNIYCTTINICAVIENYFEFAYIPLLRILFTYTASHHVFWNKEMKEHLNRNLWPFPLANQNQNRAWTNKRFLSLLFLVTFFSSEKNLTEELRANDHPFLRSLQVLLTSIVYSTQNFKWQ